MRPASARPIRCSKTPKRSRLRESMSSSDTLSLTDARTPLRRRKGWKPFQETNIPYRGSVFEEMDTDAILARRPRICLVDEFAHTNVPGSRRTKRWEDVELLLDAGIDVFTTMNIQHLESLNDQVWQITGVRVRETIPDWVVQQADEVVIIDLSPARSPASPRTRGCLRPGQGGTGAAEFFSRIDAGGPAGNGIARNRT